MPYLQNKRTGKMTFHEDIGPNSQGKREFRCSETGDIRGISKKKLDQIKDSRLKAKEVDAAPDFQSHGVSQEAVDGLKSFLDSRNTATVTPNVTETR